MLVFLAKRWFLLLLLAGALVVWLYPAGLRWTQRLDPSLTGMAAIFLSAWTLESRHLWNAVRRPLPALWATLISYGLLPALGWFGGRLLPEDDFRVGLILVSSVPCTLASAVIWTRMAGGDDATALLVTLLTNATGWLFTTAWLVLVSGAGGLPADAARQMMTKLLLVLVAPVIAGQLLRAVGPLGRAATQYKRPLGVFARLLVVLIMFKAAVEVRDRLEGGEATVTAGPLAGVLVLCLAIHLAALLLGLYTSRWLGFGRPTAIAVALSGSQKTLPVSLILFDAYFTGYPLAVVPMVFFHVGQLIVDTFIADLWAGRAPREDEVLAEAPV